MPPDYDEAYPDSPPVGGRGRRGSRLLLVSAAAVLVVALAVTGVVLANRSQGSNDAGPPVNTGSTSSDGTASAAASTPASGTPATQATTQAATTAAAPPVTYPGSASAYATAAVAAWSGGNTTRLGQLNDPGDTVFDTLNHGDYNKHFTVYQCSTADPSSVCVLYNDVGDELDLHVRNVLIGHAHAVVDGEWNPIAFPTDLQAYAQEALDDWGKHNTAAVALLTGKPGDTAFNAVPASHRGDTWTFQSSQGAAGHIAYVWQNPTHESIVFQFAAPGSVTPPANRHGLIESVSFQLAA
jgi:hypothetical protein